MTWLSRWRSRGKGKEAATLPNTEGGGMAISGQAAAPSVSVPSSATAAQSAAPGAELAAMDREVAKLGRANRLKECASLLRKVVEQSQATVGPGNPETLRRLMELGSVLAADGQHKEAEKVFRVHLTESENVSGKDSPEAFMMTRVVAEQLVKQKRFADADKVLRPSVLRSKEVLGDAHHSTALGMVAMGDLAKAQGDLAKAQGDLDTAETYLRTGLGLCEDCPDLGRNHQETLLVLDALSDLHKAKGRSELAQEFALRAYERRKAVWGSVHRDTRAAHQKLTAMLPRGSDIRPLPGTADMFQIYRNGQPVSRRIGWVKSL